LDPHYTNARILYEVRILLLNCVSMSDTLFKWCVCVGNMYWTLTLVRHVFVKCLIQKIFVESLTIVARFQHNFEKNKYIIFFKTYCINFYYYNYKNKEQIILNQP